MFIHVLVCIFKEKNGDTQKAFGVLLEMLDFACWRSNLDVWKCLHVVVHKLLLQYVHILGYELDFNPKLLTLTPSFTHLKWQQEGRGDDCPGADGYEERLVARAAFHTLPCTERLGGEQRAPGGESVTGKDPLSRLVGAVLWVVCGSCDTFSELLKLVERSSSHKHFVRFVLKDFNAVK